MITKFRSTTYPNKLILQAAHRHCPVTERDDSIGRPQQEHRHLGVHGDIQPGDLHGNGQGEHAQSNRGVEGPEEGVAPEGIVHPTNIDGHQGEGDAQKVHRQEELVVLLRFAGEDVVDGGHEHAEAEADQEAHHQHLIAEGGVGAQELQIEDGQSDEEDASGQMAPDIDLKMMDKNDYSNLAKTLFQKSRKW